MSLLGAFVDVVAHVHIVLRLGYLSIMRHASRVVISNDNKRNVLTSHSY